VAQIHFTYFISFQYVHIVFIESIIRCSVASGHVHFMAVISLCLTQCQYHTDDMGVLLNQHQVQQISDITWLYLN